MPWSPMEKPFHIEIASELEYDALIANIYWNGAFVCLVTQDGPDKAFEVVMPSGPEEAASRLERLPLDDLMEALTSARNRLSSMGWR